MSTPVDGAPAGATGPSAPESLTPGQRLAQLGLELPPVVAPLASYVPSARTGALVFTSGQLPMVGGALAVTGLVDDVTGDADDSSATATVPVEVARDLASTAALNALAALAAEISGGEGDQAAALERVVRIVKVVGFVASAPGFTGQPAVINGASDLLTAVLGDAGRHARSAVGVAQLPLGSPVEVELIAEVR